MNEAHPIKILFGVSAILLVIMLFIKARLAKARRKRLLLKYGDAEIVSRIIDRTIWTGETAEQLRDSLGRPPDIDQKVLKTKKKELWKYAHRGAIAMA